MLPRIPMHGAELVPVLPEHGPLLLQALLASGVPLMEISLPGEAGEWARRASSANARFSGRGRAAWTVMLSGKPVGVMLARVSAPEAMVACVLVPEARGLGLARDATLCLLRWLADQGISLVRADTLEGNRPARRVLESCGFLEGRHYSDRAGSEVVAYSRTAT